MNVLFKSRDGGTTGVKLSSNLGGLKTLFTSLHFLEKVHPKKGRVVSGRQAGHAPVQNDILLSITIAEETAGSCSRVKRKMEVNYE